MSDPKTPEDYGGVEDADIAAAISTVREDDIEPVVWALLSIAKTLRRIEAHMTKESDADAKRTEVALAHTQEICAVPGCVRPRASGSFCTSCDTWEEEGKGAS